MMKRRATLLPALGLLGLTGCILAQPAVPIAPSAQSSRVTTAAPVRPEQVTSQNAEKMSQALADELDREAQHEITAPALPRQ